MGIATAVKRRASRENSLADALFTTTQQRVLARLFGQPNRSFYATELITQTGAGSGAVQRELARLEQSGLVTVKRLGSQKHYQANPASPLYEELCAIVQKTVGLAEPLRMGLAPLQDRIRAAFVYGSVAKRQDTAASDIDLMVISDAIGYPELFSALEALQSRLGRTVNPQVYTLADLRKKMAEKNSFVTRVMEQPRIWIFGNDDELAA